VAAAAHAQLLGRLARQPEVGDLDAGLGQGRRQLAAGPVATEGGDQRDAVAVARREQRREPRAAGPRAAHGILDDRGGSIGAEALGPAVEVAVEEGVAHHGQRRPHRLAARSSSARAR
jgi:hypothetical protein